MTDAEWARVVARLTMNWPHSLPPEGALAKWRGDLGDLPAEQVEAAVEAIGADCERFPPNGHMIKAKITELHLDVPDWGVAVRALGSIFNEPETCMIDGESVPLRRRHIETLQPSLRSFVAQVGLEQINRGLDGGNEEARLRDKWKAFVKRSERDRNYAPIAPAGLRGLEGPKRLGEVVKQITESAA